MTEVLLKFNARLYYIACRTPSACIVIIQLNPVPHIKVVRELFVVRVCILALRAAQ